MPFRTSSDRIDTSRISLSVILPAPGMSRSMTYCGIGRSDSRVPRPPVLDHPPPAAILEFVGDDNPVDVFHALVAKLPFDAEPYGRAVRDRDLAPVHPV